MIKYISASGDVSTRIIKIYVETIVKCRTGNYWGVSHEAVPYYNSMIQLFHGYTFLIFHHIFESRDIVYILRPAIKNVEE